MPSTVNFSSLKALIGHWTVLTFLSIYYSCSRAGLLTL